MAKIKRCISISKTTDLQLNRIVSLLGFAKTRSDAIEFLAQQFIVDWAIENEIEVETLIETGEYEKDELSVFDRRRNQIPNIEEAKKISLEKKAKKEKLQAERELIAEKAKEVKKVYEEKSLDLSGFDEE